MHARLTWQSDSTASPETLTVDLPAEHIAEMRQLIGTDEWKASEAAMWIDYRTEADGPMTPGLFRLARITAVEPLEP